MKGPRMTTEGVFWPPQKTEAELRAKWAADRQSVADRWFEGDTAAAETMIDALPYSEIPEWQDVVTVLEKYQELVNPVSRGVFIKAGARRFPLTCDSAVTRKGELEPCGKLAVTWGDPAVFRDAGWGGMRPWPICAYHAHMGKALPLDQHPAVFDS